MRLDQLRPAQLRPEDWLWALRAGIESVALGWFLVVLSTVIVALSTSNLDAAAALSLGQSLRAGTGLWGLAFGGSIGVADSDNGVLALPLLGLTILQWFWTRDCVRRAQLLGPLSGVWMWGSATALGALLAQWAPAQGRIWPAVLGLSLLNAVAIAQYLHRVGHTPQVLLDWWDMRPHWVSPALSLARGTALPLAILSAVVLLVAGVSGAGRVSHLHDALAGGGILATLGLIALQAAWLPTAAVWATSWLVGAGFAVGQGTLYAPDRIVAGPVPALPLLGLLPSDSLGKVGVALPLVVTVGAMVAAWRRRRVLYSLRVRHALAAAVLAGTLVALGVGAAGVAACGSVGPGTMTVVGPHVGYAVLLVFLEVSVGLGAVAVLTHPYTLSLATEAASGARQRVEDGVESAVDSARERRVARARGAVEEDALGELTELGEFDEFDDLGELDELDAATDLIITAPPSTPMRSAQSLQAAQPPPRRISPWDNWREQAAHTEQGEHVEPEGRAGSAQTTRKEEDGHV